MSIELTRTIYLVRNKEVMNNAIGENFKRKLHEIKEKVELRYEESETKKHPNYYSDLQKLDF